MFVEYHSSQAVLTPAKYECDIEFVLMILKL